MTKKPKTVGCNTLPPPPDWDREPGAPEPVDPDSDTVVSRSLFTLDEETFMRSVADRLNSFIASYPNESQQVLATFIHYQHELVTVHNYMRQVAGKSASTPGITVAQLFAALLQTHHGNGFVLRPVLISDTSVNPRSVRIAKFVVERQDEEGSEHQA